MGSRAELVARRQPIGVVHAHEVGLAASTVAGHMAKAASKLGAGSRVELIAVFLGCDAPGGDEASSPTPLRQRAQG